MKYAGVKKIGELKLRETSGPLIDEVYMAVDDDKLGAVPVRPYEFVKWDGEKWAKVSDVQLLTTLDVPPGTSQSNPLMNAEETERMINAMKPIDAMTLRFEFSKKDYNPETAGVGSAGTWTKVDSPTLNVWDWTNENANWGSSFKGAFLDEDNSVRVIAAGDTSAVTSTEKMFAGLYEGTPSSGYNPISRNNVVDCCSFDLSGSTNSTEMFTFSTLQTAKFVDFSSYTKNLNFFYADTYIQSVPNLDCSNATSIGQLFMKCANLVKVGTIKISNKCKTCLALCHGATKLISFDGLIGDISGLNDFRSMFQYCYSLSYVGTDLDLSLVSGNKANSMFFGCNNLKKLPFKNLTSEATNISFFMASCYQIPNIPIDEMDTSRVTNFYLAFAAARNIDTIPDIDVSSATNVKQMFRECFNVKFGIIEMYNKLLARGSAITDHSDCFQKCGINTQEGRAALAQIPASWGGLAEG